MSEFMRNSDAFAWDMEHDPGLRSTVVTVITLDRSPDWEVLLDRFERIGRLVPMFRQRVVESLPPAPPRWVHDPDFDLRYHLRRVIAPHPGTFDTVLEMARRAEMTAFDTARPLWEVTLVDELADGGAALVCKLHHSLTDGIGGVQIAMLLFDLTEEPPDRGPLPPVPEPEGVGRLGGLRHLLRYDADLVHKGAHTALVTLPRAALAGVRRPRRSLLGAAGTAASVYRTVRPINHTASPVMKQRRLVRELGVHEVPLRELKDAAHQVGGTLNDAFLAGVTGGLRRYHSHHGVAVSDLHVTMPVSIRGEDDAVGGNRLTLMRFTLPVGIADPAERIREIHRCAASVRTERSLPYTQVIAGGLNLLPRWYIAAILRHVDFVASDVPGVPVPVYVAGAAVRMQYAFGPTIGAGVNVTLMTYVDTCSLGINVDTGAIPDFEQFYDCLAAGFEEVLGTARPPAEASASGTGKPVMPRRPAVPASRGSALTTT